MRFYLGVILAFFSFFMVSCGGGGGGGGSSSNYTYITLLDGYIKNAHVKDYDSTPVRYISDKNDTHYNQYRFYDKPKGHIYASGGYFIGSDLENKMVFKVPADTKIISPVVTFLNKYPDTKNDISVALRTNENQLRSDYIKNPNIKIARFAQIVYALSVHGLDSRFSSYLKGVENYEGIVLAAVRASEGTTYENKIQAFINSLSDFDSVDTLERDIYNQKKIMQENITSSSGGSGTPDTPVYTGGLEVKSVSLQGNLALDISFSEALESLTSINKSAIKLNKIIHSKVALDSNSTAVVNGRSLTVTLGSAIATTEEGNLYTVGVSKSLVSSEGLILDNNTSEVIQAPTALSLQTVSYKDSKNLKATFNLPIDISTINQNDFLVKVASTGLEPTNITVDSTNANILNITLGNVMTENLGYDLIIQNENLTSTTGLKMSTVATKEFEAKVSIGTDLNEGFNLVNASVNKEQTKLTLNFSKTIMSNPTPDMVTLNLKAKQSATDLNITQDSVNSSLLHGRVVNVEGKMLSLEQNATYELSVSKQKIFSLDGKRTLGTTYSKDLEVVKYPKVTNASISPTSISITFNMPMKDINASNVTVEDGNISNLVKIEKIKVSGSGTNFAISESNNTAFKGEIVRIKIDENIYSKDETSVLEVPYMKDFNLSR